MREEKITHWAKQFSSTSRRKRERGKNSFQTGMPIGAEKRGAPAVSDGGNNGGRCW